MTAAVAVAVGLQQDGAITWLGSRERGGSGWRRTGLFDETWGSPMWTSCG